MAVCYTGVTIERQVDNVKWEAIAHPNNTPEDIKECYDLCVKKENSKRDKKPLRVLRTTYEVLDHYLYIPENQEDLR